MLEVLNSVGKSKESSPRSKNLDLFLSRLTLTWYLLTL